MKLYTMPVGDYQTNCYILCAGGDPCVLVDPGYEPERILARVASLGKTVAAILLTHGHFDHVGGVRAIAADTGCKVYLCERELTLPETLTAGKLYYTDTYAEGDVLQIADLQIRVLHTPGHTPGGVCLICRDVMFSGDTLFAGSCGRTDFPGGSWDTLHASLGRLAKLEGEYRVCPGHGPETTLSWEKQTNPYLR